MDLNVGSTDRLVRLAVGIAALIVGIYGFSTGMSNVVVGVALLIGAVMLVTGVTQSCPLYTLAGIDTSE